MEFVLRSEFMKPTTSRSKAIVNVSQTRWVAYATAGAATAVVGVNSAEADIHYSGPINQVFNAPPGSSVHQTFAFAPGASFYLFHYRGGSGTRGVAFFGAFGAVSAAFNGFSAGGFPYVSKLPAGENPAAHP